MCVEFDYWEPSISGDANKEREKTETWRVETWECEMKILHG